MSLDKVIEGVTGSTFITHVALSPSARQVIYSIAPKYHSVKQENATSALWISDLSPGSKSRQLTSGDHNDSLPTWSADESGVFFLSDRHKQDDKPGPAAIYAIPTKVGGESYAFTSKENKSAIGQFWLSPDGRYIAYVASREPTAEEQRKEKEKDDPIIFGDKKANAQLWLLTLTTRQVRRLQLGPKDNWHVQWIAWSPDSKDIMVLMKENSSLEFNESTAALLRLSVLPHAAGLVQQVCTLPRLSAGVVLWPSQDEISLLQSFIPDQLSSSITLYFRSSLPEGDIWKQYYGDVEDLVGIQDLHDGKTLAPMVAYGVQTRLDLLTSAGPKKTIWYGDGNVPDEYDIKLTKNGDYVLVAVVSSGTRNEPPELWTGTLASSKLAEGETLKLTEKLSSHNAWTAELPKISVQVIKYKAKDGTEIEGIVTWPKHKERKALPTVLFPHGGPYHRDTPDFDLKSYWAKELPVFAGYLVLCPQYRGSSGRGNRFARSAHAQMGTHDWTDCYDMLQYAIAQGWADKDMLGLAGWSQGGFLTAWGVSQTKDLFKAAVMGAGVCDWGMMAAESDMPEFEADLGGSWPWTENRVDQNGSPIRHIKGIKTPVLILHGEKDARVPTTQGITFHRGLRRVSGHPDNHQLIIYPRELHAFTEKKHAEDVIRRLIGHMDAYLI
ncbi:alpha/beta-hydrolase [Dacryopinax primogenitus]|uniref:Dipeptidyl-peptidase V n=1 Tax=Dacryopinax primogenitus (strain DJM 731) TaxID=1858805 RepID=M5G2E7_DACPD|nr:alpha/beta-hydrolase [Dacryopinax primogenitus]EJU00037.1 alpha/beta-hydrolase [Dacryopinax primogenitus]